MSDHIEAVLLWNEPQPAGVVERWFTSHGLAVASLQAGLLVSGSAVTLAAALGVDPALLTPGSGLPVPEPLRAFVTSFQVTRPRRFMA